LNDEELAVQRFFFDKLFIDGWDGTKEFFLNSEKNYQELGYSMELDCDFDESISYQDGLKGGHCADCVVSDLSIHNKCYPSYDFRLLTCCFTIIYWDVGKQIWYWPFFFDAFFIFFFLF